jgi:hypothetical protein
MKKKIEHRHGNKLSRGWMQPAFLNKFMSYKARMAKEMWEDIGIGGENHK